MAQRPKVSEKDKPKRPAVGAVKAETMNQAVGGQRGVRASGSSNDQRLQAVEAERDSLKRELEAAHARIAMLEESRRLVSGRIDAVIGSLNTIADAGD